MDRSTWGAGRSLPRALGDQDDGAPVAKRGRGSFNLGGARVYGLPEPHLPRAPDLLTREYPDTPTGQGSPPKLSPSLLTRGLAG